MRDEEWLFHHDVSDKKRTARGAFNKRTHTGKGGAVKFPSDYLSKKELKALNGEMKSYRLNDPMKWPEFKAMPNDIQILYIKTLREKYGASTVKLAEMFGVPQQTVSYHLRKIGIGTGRGHFEKFDKEGWVKFINGIRDNKSVEADTDNLTARPEDVGAADMQNEACCQVHETVIIPVRETEQLPVIPNHGTMSFECPADDALNVVKGILKNSLVRISVRWEGVGLDG